MCILFYPRAIRYNIEIYPSLKFCFELQLYYTAADQTSNSNISSNSKPNILGYESVSQVGSSNEKTRGRNVVLLSLKVHKISKDELVHRKCILKVLSSEN
jgi:hypothetical protein